MKNYEDIIDIKYNGVKNHQKMSISNRAFQFAPFRALTGYTESIEEEARITINKHILTEEQNYIINEKINIIKNYINKEKFNFTYFIKDKIKDGGIYKNINDYVIKVDEVKNLIILKNNIKINFNDIIDINSNIFGD